MMAPVGPVYQAGTLSGNPLVTAAGIATLKLLKADGLYESLEEKSARLARGLESAAREASVRAHVNRVGSMMTLFFRDGPVTRYSEATACDTERFGRYHARMLAEGVYLPPSQFEACFVSTAHTDEDLDRTVEAARRVLRTI